jgi:hypothetical protein
VEFPDALRNSAVIDAHHIDDLTLCVTSEVQSIIFARVEELAMMNSSFFDRRLKSE